MKLLLILSLALVLTSCAGDVEDEKFAPFPGGSLTIPTPA